MIKMLSGNNKIYILQFQLYAIAYVRVVQYTRTVTVRISHVSIRTDRQQGYTVCKVCFTVRKSHLISEA